MNQDGDVFPCNEPVLVKKQQFRVTQSSAAPVNVGEDLGTWLNATDAEMKNYRIDAYFIARVSEVAAQVDLYLDAATGWDQNFRTTNAGTIGETLSPVSFWPQNGTDQIEIDFDWASGNLYGIVVLLAYRMPDSICIE